ncbi:MAG: nucleotidyltransferase [Pirellulales bacterium]|nr:nucleotidyltransferase [Pirellulales bacterium]
MRTAASGGGARAIRKATLATKTSFATEAKLRFQIIGLGVLVDRVLQETLSDAIDFLSTEKVSYALIGGLAASLRGEPRVTADVDFVIDTDVNGALELLKKIEKSPFVPLFAGVEDVVSQSFILPLRHRTTLVKVDLTIGLSGFERQLIQRATLVNVSGLAVRLITAEDLLIMKLLAGRPRDQQDATGIVVVQGDSLDWSYCQKIARELSQAVDIDLAVQLDRLRTDKD